MNYNRVTLAGRLTRDPELRYSKNQTAVCKFGLAVNRRVKSGDEWKEEVTFVDVTMFGKRGEAFEQYHKKGDAAFIDGSLAFDSWDDKNTGQKRSKLYVIAESWEFTGGKQDSQQAQPQRQRREAVSSALVDNPFAVDPDVDDTPF